MDFKFSAHENTFRDSVREFLTASFPTQLADMGIGEELVNDQERWDLAMTFLRSLSTHGWIAPHWPKEYGGAGMTIIEQLVYNEEMALHGAHPTIGPGVTMVGPTLIVHGTDEQKQRHLSGMTSARVVWCQGYSEPGSGSDLASLQTRAVKDGDDFIINGQKIWTSFATKADWMFMLARTDPEAPKHRGISAFLLDMHSPGVTVRPLTNLAGQRGFINEVFFEDVRIPKANIVGEENRGWYVGATLLDFERSNISAAATARREFQQFSSLCRELPGRTSARLCDDASVRLKLADHLIEIEVGRFISYRVASMQARGAVPNMEASMAKLYHSEVNQRFQNAKVNIIGMAGLLRECTSAGSPPVGMRYLRSIPATIAGGTSEIQRNIIATRGLGLPRG